MSDLVPNDSVKRTIAQVGNENKKSKNAVHHSFFITISFSVDVTPEDYEELFLFVKTYGKYYAIKCEDVWHEGKLHLHAILIRLPAKNELGCELPSYKISHGPKRTEEVKNFIVNHCKGITKRCLFVGSKHSIDVSSLTTTTYLDYLSKESQCNVFNLPYDMVFITTLLSNETGVRIADRKMDHWEKDYNEHDGWIVHPRRKTVPTLDSCAYFLYYMMNEVRKYPTMCGTPTEKNSTLVKNAQKLLNYMLHESGREDPFCYYCRSIDSTDNSNYCNSCLDLFDRAGIEEGIDRRFLDALVRK